MKPHRVEISHKTIIFTVVFLITLSLMWKLRDIFILFFVCFIFMQALNPYVARLEKLMVPRALAIILLYAIILTFLSFALAGIVPVLVDQTSAFINSLPSMVQNFNFFGASAYDISSQLKILEGLPTSIARTAFSLVSNLFSAFVVFMITFYLLMERKNFGRYSFNFFGPQGKDRALEIINQLELRLGSWVNAEIFLMTIVGLLSYFGYLILGLNYAVPLAIVAGVLEIIPNIGPTVATILAAAIGLSVSPITALLAVVWGIVIQQLENNFIVPKIMKETVGLNPLITILLIAAGAKLNGVSGAILAVPTYLTLETIFKVIWAKKFRRSR